LLKAKQLQKEDNIYFKAEEYWLNKKGCPIGTVPIRRMTQEQLQSAKDASLNLANEYLADNTIDFAGISIKASPEINRFTGASSIITLYNPQVNGLGQYSSATIFLQSGENATITEQLQAGWIIHPKLYGDGQTRLYTRWTADVHQKTGCYNTICPGFVQIYKDQEYYLQLATMFAIGFWPDTLFKELRNGSETVRFGGKAHTPASETVSPPMGNGQFQADNLHLTCHMRQVMYGVDIDQEVQPDESLVQTHRCRCYCEGKENNARDGYWDYNFLFGSAGNCTDSPITCM
ncbi:hypothetical protein H5410_023205, partial [Solanum commersonii]